MAGELTSPATVYGVFTLMKPVRLSKVKALVTCNQDWLAGMEFFISGFAEGSKGLEGRVISKDDPCNVEEIVDTLSADPSYANLRRLVKEQPQRLYRYNQFRSYMADAQRDDDADEDYPRVVLYFCGDPGSGKSYAARQWLSAMAQSHAETFYSVDSVQFTGAGFCLGYRGSHYVLIDDWDPRSLPVEAWNKLLDSYRTTVNVKGGEQAWKPRYIAITRTHEPHELGYFGLRSHDLWQIIRRFSSVILCTMESNEHETHHSTEAIDPQQYLDMVIDAEKASKVCFFC